MQYHMFFFHLFQNEVLLFVLKTISSFWTNNWISDPKSDDLLIKTLRAVDPQIKVKCFGRERMSLEDWVNFSKLKTFYEQKSSNHKIWMKSNNWKQFENSIVSWIVNESKNFDKDMALNIVLIIIFIIYEHFFPFNHFWLTNQSSIVNIETVFMYFMHKLIRHLLIFLFVEKLNDKLSFNWFVPLFLYLNQNKIKWNNFQLL